MRIRIVKLAEDLRASYWFLPFCMLIAAFSLALATCWLDTNPAVRKIAGNSMLGNSGADDARGILSVIATSVLGVAGVAFSITIVAVSFASSNFGPRLIRNFMRDRGNQLTLGMFVGTFVFCLLVLASVHGATTKESGDEVAAFVPYLSVVMAVVLAISCIGVLIYYFHHIAEFINIEKIISDIGHQLKMRILETYPNNRDNDLQVDADDFESAAAELDVRRVSSESVGYVQAISHDQLLELAESHSLLINVHYRPGDYLCTHDKLLSVWSEEPDKVPIEELRACFATGPQRTKHQNVLFLVDQLAEVIARALSPGVNDPMTAVSCLNCYRTALLEYIHTHPDAIQDSDWKRWQVQIKPITFDRICSVMFDKTRQYIVADVNVLLHALALFSECAWQAQTGSYRDTLVGYLRQFHTEGLEVNDRPTATKIINEHYEQALKLLENDDPFFKMRQNTTWFGGSA